MSQVWEIGDINPTTTSPLTDISRLTRSMDALHSLFSGPSSPQVTVPYMFWADTTEGILKRRNAENSSWVFALSLTESFIKNINTFYTTLVTDNGSMLLVDAVSTDITINLVSASSARAGSVIAIKKIDNTTNKVILNPNASETIDGDTNYVFQITHETIILRSDGANWRVINVYKPRVVLPKTGEYIVTRTDDRAIISILVATSIVRLPIITDIHNGFTVTIKKVAAGVTTIDPRAVAIDGVIALKTLTAVNQAITLVSNGTSWLILSEANVPTASSLAIATIAQMKSSVLNTVAVSPAITLYSPSATQCVARYNSVSNMAIWAIGCSVIAIAGIGKSRITFTLPYVNGSTYAITGSGTNNIGSASNMSVGLITFENFLSTSVDSQVFVVNKLGSNTAVNLSVTELLNVSIQVQGKLA